MLNTPNTTINNSIIKDGFYYNFIKTQLKKGSTISKTTHPIKQVEDIKQKLSATDKLTNTGENYILRKTITTSLKMAENLHYGRLINTQSIEWQNDIRQAITNQTIIKETGLQNLMPPTYTTSKLYFMDCLRLKELSQITTDFTVINSHNSDQFSPLEKLFYDELRARSIISKNSRHGRANKKECDIVDEENGIQIEVTIEFKNRIIKNKSPHKDLDTLSLECIDNLFIQPSASLLKKYYEKTYTDKFKKHLAIYCIGNTKSLVTEAQKIKEKLSQNDNIKNNFERLYFIWNDFVDNNKTYLFYFKKDGQPMMEEINTNFGILRKGQSIDCSQLNQDDRTARYYIETESIFEDGNEVIGFLPASDIIQAIRKLRIITNQE